MRAKFGDPPAPLPATAFRNPDPRGSLLALAHGVISWTLAKKEDMMSEDKNEEIRRKVMKGIKNPGKDNPYHKDNVKRDKTKAKQVQRAIDKRKGKHTRRRDDGDGVVDSGMFSS